MEPWTVGISIWVLIRILLIVGAFWGIFKTPFPNRKVCLLTFVLMILYIGGTYQFILSSNTALGLSVIGFAPFINGMLFVFLYAWFSKKQRLQGETDVRPVSGPAMVLLFPSLLIVLELVVLFAVLLEGIVCLLMAAPFLWLFTILGALVAYWALRLFNIRFTVPLVICLLALSLLPCISQPIENHFLLETVKTKVTTSIVIHAPADKVFRYVESFPPIPADAPLKHLSEAFFVLGLPAPQESVVDCHGPGCMRHCIFNQNTQFDEQVQIYEPGKELTFDVVSIVGPQNPITGVDIHIMPGGAYFDNSQGRFLLTEVTPGVTRVDGTTWYQVRSSVNWYAKPWADLMLHTIHRRVLEHVKYLAESEV